MPKAYIFLANGFEDIEALTVVDLMRRADISIETISIHSTREVTTSHNITLFADRTFEETTFDDADILILPGGMPGTLHLGAYTPLTDLLTAFYNKGGKIAAICAAPSVFANLGFLKGRKATSYPSFMDKLQGADPVEEKVVVDGNVTTSRGMGTAIDFGLSLIAQLCGTEKAGEIAESIVYTP